MKHLVVDGKNAAYRSLFASKQSSVHPATILLRSVSSWVDRFLPQAIHIFWDSTSHHLWRRRIFPSYKIATCRDHGFKVDEEMVDLQKIAIRMFSSLPCRQYYRSRMEADDLIYAFCRTYFQPTIIVSSDGDLRQLSYLWSHVLVFDPTKNKEFKQEDIEIDPVEMKSLCGDVSDAISGYRGIGPKRAAQLLSDPLKWDNFFETHDKNIYLRNRQLIDLSACPASQRNIFYVRRVMACDENQLDVGMLRRLIQEKKIQGMMTELDRRLISFRGVSKDK